MRCKPVRVNSPADNFCFSSLDGSGSDERTDVILFFLLFFPFSSEGGFSSGPGCNGEPDAALNRC